MATVTVIIQLRRTEGRTPVDLDALADAVAEALTDAGAGVELQAPSIDGDELTYEVTQVRVARTADVDTALSTDDPPDVIECGWCHQPALTEPHGQPRKYCSDACRVAAWRARN